MILPWSWFFFLSTWLLVRPGTAAPISRRSADGLLISENSLNNPVVRSPGAKETTCYVQAGADHESSADGSHYVVSFSGGSISVDCTPADGVSLSFLLDNNKVGEAGSEGTATYVSDSLSTGTHTLAIDTGDSTPMVYFHKRSEVNISRDLVSAEVVRSLVARSLTRRGAKPLTTAAAAIIGSLSFLIALIAALVLYRRRYDPPSDDIESGDRSGQRLRRHNTSWIRRFRKAQPADKPLSPIPFSPVPGFHCPTRPDGSARKPSFGSDYSDKGQLEVPRTAHVGDYFSYKDEKRAEPVGKLPPLDFSRSKARGKRMGFIPKLTPSWPSSRRVQRVEPPRPSAFGSHYHQSHRVDLNPIHDPHMGQHYGRF